MSYFVDSLFRKDPSTPGAAPTADAGSVGLTPAGGLNSPSAASTREASRIFPNAFRTGSLTPEDSKYLGQVVAQRTGLNQQDAEKRETDAYAKAQAALNGAQMKAKEAADAARRASAYAALWLVISMFIGAFVASFAATYAVAVVTFKAD